MNVLALILLLASTSPELPIPSALKAATTVYVVNSAHPRVLENTLKALAVWKRWTVVADAADADITLTLGAQPTKQIYNWATNSSMTVNGWTLTITSRDGTQIYGVTFGGNSPEKELKKLATRLEPFASGSSD